VCDAGIAGLERIPSLTRFHCHVYIHHERDEPVSLQVATQLVLSDSHPSPKLGLSALELAPALEFVDLRRCAGIVDAVSIVLRAAERSVKVLVLHHFASKSRLGVT
jgi:hypothetical protein